MRRERRESSTMSISHFSRRTWVPALMSLLGLFGVVAGSRPALAHAILLEASPAANSTVRGPDLDVRLRFNSRIDGERSRLSLGLPGGKVRILELESPAVGPAILSAKLRGLAPGSYRLRWQVLAADGHITRGEIPFQVK